MKRPILIALIGYIIGIIWGLYFNISIAFCYPILIILYILIQNIKLNSTRNTKIFYFIKKKLRILKFFIHNKQVKYMIVVFLVVALCSNITVQKLNKEHETKYENIEKAKFIATIVEEKKEKQYYLQYKVKIEQVNNKKVKPHYLLLKIKNKNTKIKLGDKIQFTSEYQAPQGQRNTGGFNYKLYLKTQKIYGLVTTNSVKVLKSNNQNLFQILSNKILEYSQNTIKKFITNEDEQNLILGILIGKDDNISEELREDFSNSSLSHILAVSGMHVSYVIMGLTMFFSIIKISKKVTKIFQILLLLLFWSLTGFTATVTRAVFMSLLFIISTLVYKKNDILTTLSITLWIILINNPFAIFNIGLVLSFCGTLGILIFYKILIKKFRENHKELYLADKLKIREILYKKIAEAALVSICAQIFILPVMLYNFNSMSFTFLISNILVSFLIGPILIFGVLLIISNTILLPTTKIITICLHSLLQILIKIAEFVSNLPLSHIILPTIKIHHIIIYYIFLILLYHVIKTGKMYVIVCKIKAKFKEILTVILIIAIINNVVIYTNTDLRIYCIDVGQGDSTLVITPHNKTILIDGGGSSSEEFDVGKSTLVPYLLDREITKIDYVLISHFDTDHCAGIVAVLDMLKVKNMLISKQFEKTENYTRIMKLAKQKKVKMHVVKQGDKLKIDNVYMYFLWPNGEEMIKENAINNNSIVAKLVYNKFNMLFTGDIEQIAEQKIIQYYGETDLLKATILKTAHHGSKTSSTKEFLDLVSPKIATIGVGKNNFGHPSNITLENLKAINCKVCRTDLDGEIMIKVDRSGKVKINTIIK